MPATSHARALQALLETERVEALLRRRLQLEELVSRLSAQFINVTLADFDECLEGALRAVGEFTAVDRASIIVSSADASHFLLLRGWSIEPTAPEVQTLARIELDQAPWWRDSLEHGAIVAIPSVASLADDYGSGKALLRARGHRATIMVPIQSHLRVVGFLTLACLGEEREWDSDTESMLRLVAEVFANALERRRIEETLRSSEERFRALIEHSEDPVSLFDVHGRLLYTSPSGTHLYGATTDEPVGKSLWEFVHPEDREKVENLTARLLQSPGAPHRERIRRLSANRYLWLDVTVTNWLDNAAIAAVVVNTHDVTAQVEAEESIRRLNEDLERRVLERTAELESAVQEMKAFNYSVSHDLRGPLRVIAGYSRLLSERMTPATDHEGIDQLARIESSAQHMSKLIDALLALSRLSRDPLHLEAVDLSQLASEVVETLAMSDRARRIDVHIAPGCIAVGDYRLLGVLLENLLGNAWKYTARTAEPRIEMGRLESASASSPEVFFVRDNGAGFDMTYADKLFRTFSRLHSAADFEGIGIGLAIVHKIVQRHGGRVWAESLPEHGATFYFTLGMQTA